MAFTEPVFTELTTISVVTYSTKLHPKRRKSLELTGKISCTSVSKTLLTLHSVLQNPERLNVLNTEIFRI
jgi:hypothetical protein